MRYFKLHYLLLGTLAGIALIISCQPDQSRFGEKITDKVRTVDTSEVKHNLTYSYSLNENQPIEVKGIAAGATNKSIFIWFDDLQAFLGKEDLREFQQLLIIAKRTEQVMPLLKLNVWNL